MEMNLMVEVAQQIEVLPEQDPLARSCEHSNEHSRDPQHQKCS